MNAKKIKNIGWNEKKRFDLPGLPEFSELSVKRFHGVRSLMGRNRGKTDYLCAIWPDFGNLIVSRFPFAALSGKELIKVSMELQHYAGGKGNVGMVRVYRIQDIPAGCSYIFLNL
jgi:hypothetical protein